MKVLLLAVAAVWLAVSYYGVDATDLTHHWILVLPLSYLAALFLLLKS